jgi:hypothetical protein
MTPDSHSGGPGLKSRPLILLSRLGFPLSSSVPPRNIRVFPHIRPRPRHSTFFLIRCSRSCHVHCIVCVARINLIVTLFCVNTITVKAKVKQSHYRPGQALRAPGGWGSQISRLSAHKSANVVNPTHRPPLPPQEIFLVLISVRVWVDPRAIVRPEGLSQWKILITP